MSRFEEQLKRIRQSYPKYFEDRDDAFNLEKWIVLGSSEVDREEDEHFCDSCSPEKAEA